MPLLPGYLIAKRRDLIRRDVARWASEMSVGRIPLLSLLALPEFRSLFYHRLRHGGSAGRVFAFLARIIYRPQLGLQLKTVEIGPGLFIKHGQLTVLAARTVGADCTIFHHVVVDAAEPNGGRPQIGSGVMLRTRAIVLGDVEVAEGAQVAAAAVVVDNVPPRTTVAGVPARRIRG
ncbi:MAG TPA: hypothetical protein VGH52_04825 [Gaiellaceae bacterium]